MVKNQKLLIANGVNLDLLGTREPLVYGTQTLKDLNSYILEHFKCLTKAYKINDISLEFFQSNDEALFLAEVSKPYLGALINAGAWTHTSIALADRLIALKLPYIEVHLSNLSQRQNFRQKSFLAPNAEGVVYGMGFNSYLAGLVVLIQNIKKNRSAD